LAQGTAAFARRLTLEDRAVRPVFIWTSALAQSLGLFSPVWEREISMPPPASSLAPHDRAAGSGGRSMLPLLHGFEISTHNLKGLYVCTFGTSRRVQSSKAASMLICTLREGKDTAAGLDREMEETDGRSPKFGPLGLSYQGVHRTLRPWYAHSCFIAAAIHNHLIHFPIRPGSHVVAIDCDLRALSHLQDIVGAAGRIFAIFDNRYEKKPSTTEVANFHKRHQNVSVIFEDLEVASLERYERLFGLPLACKFAFLMGLDPRLGADSPAQVLTTAPCGGEAIARRIFLFLEHRVSGPSRMGCLVSRHWPPGARVDTVREVVLSHMDILQKWQLGNGNSTRGANGSANGGSQGSRSWGGHKVRMADQQVQDAKPAPLWVLMDLPTDHITTTKSQNLDVRSKLNEVVDDMKRLTSGLRTGLSAKEQLLLGPYFPNHAVLLLKYSAHRDQRVYQGGSGSRSRRKFPVPPGLEENNSGTSATENDFPPGHPGMVQPSLGDMPVPAFLSKQGGALAQLGGYPLPSPGDSTQPPMAPITRPRNAAPGSGREELAVAAAAGAASSSMGGRPPSPPPGLFNGRLPCSLGPAMSF